MAQFNRVFHPVGQGAFYSETHENENGRITIVYDCGSCSLAPNNLKGSAQLKKRINGGLQNDVVELLFISHFHADHINGIQYLKPKYIVIPFISEDLKILWGVADKLYNLGYVANLKDELLRRFPDTSIIEVTPFDEERPIQETNERLIEDIATSYNKTVNSGERLKIQSVPDWLYIPFNPMVNQKRIDDFKAEINTIGNAAAVQFSYTDLANLDSERIRNHFAEIKAAFERVIGSEKLNDFSMLVYSGPTSRINLICELKSCRHPLYNFCHHCPWHFNWHRAPACLYTGDSKVSANNLKQIYISLGISQIENIGTIQIPHHGAKDNFDTHLKSYFYDNSWHEFDKPMTYVISVGTNNKYGHPSWWVMSELLKDFPRSNVMLVLEDITSGLIEHGSY